MSNSSTASRRTFLQTVTAGVSLFGIPAKSYGRILGSNDRIGIGIIGAGRIGRVHLGRVQRNEDTDLVAICDVYARNLGYAAANAPEAQTFGDHRQLLDNERIDAVIVASPDHWHALHTVDACRAGKDVYVEKPASVAIAEGRAMVDAAREHDRIVQVGTQQRSGDHFAQAAYVVGSGALGPVTFVRCWNVSNEAPGGIGAGLDLTDPPPGLDWDRWLGPAPERPYNINRFGVSLDGDDQYRRWSTFRYFWDYAGGMMTDWGTHLLDIVQWAMQVDRPESVVATGGKFVLTDDRETPDTLLATYAYPNFVCTYENRACNAYGLNDERYGITFYGALASLYINRDYFQVLPERNSGLKPLRVERGNDMGESHLANFVACIRSRSRPTSDIEFGHRSSTAAILGNMAFRTGGSLVWNGDEERVVGNEKADGLVSRSYRDPWTL